MTHALSATALGYPRIGPDRELKRATEGYWAGRLDAAELDAAARDIETQQRTDLTSAGLTSVPSNVFSLYDHVLDAAVSVDAIPPRHRELGLSPIDTYFAMARGTDAAAPLEMTKWFDTNYHYLVPELGPDTRFTAVADKPLAEYRRAKEAGVETRPVLLGPVTFLLLSKANAQAPEEFAPIDLLEPLLDVYVQLIETLTAEGAEWIQLDEPAFNLDRKPGELRALQQAYHRLLSIKGRPKFFVTGGYGEFADALDILVASGVDALGLDLISGANDLNRLTSHTPLSTTVIVAGVVDGRNIWRTDTKRAASQLGTLLGVADHIGVSTSCSLLHVPVDAAAETDLDPALLERLAFARQKLSEVSQLAGFVADGAAPHDAAANPAIPKAWQNSTVQGRLAALRPEHSQRPAYAQRAAAQAARLGLPALPTTTIGSFPQTSEIRKARADYRAGRLSEADYVARMRGEIEETIALQERLELDVLVHGEAERNDMVQYFAEALDGFVSTKAGWVQSYGSRCVRPPILFGDVTRNREITVGWSTFAQSLTSAHVKGMLTGPVTILAWSFVRDDQPLADTARQVALALRDEVHDLEKAGIRVIQVDEPALRELLPPRQRDHAAYLDWAVDSFKLATAGVSEATQIHTHLCYSEFGEVIDAISALDADVTSIEASRSHMEVLDDLNRNGYSRGVGPGVYDIHSPRVPSVEEVTTSLRAALRAVPGDRLWVNPDCGLKTRGYAEVEPALRAIVTAAKALRQEKSTTA